MSNKTKLIIVIAIVVISLYFLKQYRTLKVPVQGKITSKYGNRIHPISGVLKFHNGIDIAAATGTAVKAPASGVITKRWTDSSNGNALQIKHNNGYTTGYAHLSAWNVAVGDKVVKGQQVAKVGNTGNSTGAHLHFTVKDKKGFNIDPESVLV